MKNKQNIALAILLVMSLITQIIPAFADTTINKDTSGNNLIIQAVDKAGLTSSIRYYTLGFIVSIKTSDNTIFKTHFKTDQHACTQAEKINWGTVITSEQVCTIFTFPIGSNSFSDGNLGKWNKSLLDNFMYEYSNDPISQGKIREFINNPNGSYVFDGIITTIPAYSSTPSGGIIQGSKYSSTPKYTGNVYDSLGSPGGSGILGAVSWSPTTQSDLTYYYNRTITFSPQPIVGKVTSTYYEISGGKVTNRITSQTPYVTTITIPAGQKTITHTYAIGDRGGKIDITDLRYVGYRRDAQVTVGEATPTYITTTPISIDLIPTSNEKNISYFYEKSILEPIPAIMGFFNANDSNYNRKKGDPIQSGKIHFVDKGQPLPILIKDMSSNATTENVALRLLYKKFRDGSIIVLKQQVAPIIYEDNVYVGDYSYWLAIITKGGSLIESDPIHS